MTTYDDIRSLPPVNAVDPDKVEELKVSMLASGWQGAPILYTDLGLITGSHRKAALDAIDAAWDTLTDAEKNVAITLLNSDIALDVTGILNDYCEENDFTWDDIDFSSLGKIFEGTGVEQYKDEIVEW